MGEETDGVVESTSKLQEKLQALTGVNILTDTGAYKDTYTILKEIGEVWQDLDELDKSAALELMAGKNRANTLSAILNNIEDLESAYESALNAEGSALRENEAYLDSIQGKIDKFTNAVQTMWMHFLNDEAIKFIVDLGTALVKLTDNIGVLKTAVMAFTAIKTVAASTEDAFKAIGSAIEGAIKSTSKATVANVGSTIIGNAGTIGVGLLKGLGAGLAIGSIMAVVELALTGLNNWIYAEEIAIEKANEALNKYKEEQKTLEDQKDTVDDLSESYMRLSSGVNTLTNENVGLTVEAYQEYLDVCNKIAGIYPELVNSYDAQGNAILSLKGNVEGLSAAYEKAQEDSANLFLTAENKRALWKTYKNNVVWTKVLDERDSNGKILSYTFEDELEMLKILSSMSEKDLEKMYEQYDKETGENIQWETLEKYIDPESRLSDFKRMTAVYNGLSINSNAYSSFAQYESAVREKMFNAEQAVSDGMRGIREAISAGLIFDSTYQELDEGAKGIVNTIIDNMESDMIVKSGKDNLDDFASWFSEEVIVGVDDNKGFYKNVTDAYNTMVKEMSDDTDEVFETAREEFESAENNFKSFIPEEWYVDGKITINEDDDVVTEYFKQLVMNMEEQSKNYKVRLQMQMDFESDKTVGDITEGASKEIRRALGDLELGDDASMGDVYSEITKRLAGDDGVARTDELEDIYQDYLSGDMNEWTLGQREAIVALDGVMKLYGTDIDTVIAKLVDLGIVEKSLSDIPSFDLASESTKEDIDEFQEAISSLKSAWESINSGDMTKSDFLDLAQEFPDLMKGVDFANDDWISKAKSNIEEFRTTYVNDYLASLEEIKKAMIARGADEEDIAILDSFIAYVEEAKDGFGELEKIIERPTTISGLTDTINTLNEAITASDELFTDGVRTTEAYYNSLIDLGIAGEDVATCIDTANGYVVTNAEKLQELIAAQKESTAQTIQLRKTQAQLKYYELVDQLGDTMKSYKDLNEEQLDSVDSMFDQINAIKKTINQYQLLEDTLLGTTSAFEEFAKAQEMDSQNTYGDQYVEMAQTMYDAIYKTGEVGSAQFWAAVRANVPDDIYAHLTPGKEQIQTIANYAKENIFSGLVLDEDSFSIDYTSVKKFIEKAQDAGVFTGTDSTAFGLSQGFIDSLAEDENALEEFAKRMDMTTTQVYAMLSELDKYNADGIGLSMLFQLDNSTTSRITIAANELERLYAERKALLKQGASQGSLDANMNAIYRQESQMYSLEKQAADTVSAYAEVKNAIDSIANNPDLTMDDLREIVPEELYTTLKLDGAQTVDEALKLLKEHMMNLEEPTVLTLDIAKESVEEELKELENRFGKENLEANIVTNADGLKEIKEGIALTVNKEDLERYITLENTNQFIDDALAQEFTTTEQFLSEIAENTAIMAGKETLPEEKSSTTVTSDNKLGVINQPSESKPEVNVEAAKYLLGVGQEYQGLLDNIGKRIAMLSGGGWSMGIEMLAELSREVSDIQIKLHKGLISPEDASAQLSEFEDRAKNLKVEMPVKFKADPGQIINEVSGDQVEVEVAVENVEALGSVTQATAENAISLWEAYDGIIKGLSKYDPETMIPAGEFNEAAKIVGLDKVATDAISAADALNIFTQARKTAFSSGSTGSVAGIIDTSGVYTLDELQSRTNAYNDIISQTDEIISDNIEVTQSYKDSLKDLCENQEERNELSEYFDGIIVKNSKGIKNFVKSKKEELKTDVKLSKAQAQLKYYELYKEMRGLTDGTEDMNAVTLTQVDSLYDEMAALEGTIALYSILEAKLLGATNAYDELAEAQAIDSETDYTSKAEELASVLSEAFNTGYLGTEAAQVAFRGLIPDYKIDKSKTPDEQMDQAYEYFTNGELSKLFKIEFDDDGVISKIEMTQESVEEFTKSLIGSAESGAVFQGTWDEFTLNPAIDSLDKFAKAAGVTKEVALAYLTDLEKRDINWLDGDKGTLLDYFMRDDLEYGIQKTTKEMAKFVKEKAALSEGGITDDELQRYNDVNANIDALNKTMDTHKEKAYSVWQEYSDVNNALANADNLGKKVYEVFSNDLYTKIGLTGEETVEEVYNKILAYQLQLEQPTELVLKLASEQAQKEISKLKEELNKSGIEIEGKITLDAYGKAQYDGDTSGLSSNDQKKLQDYLDATNNFNTINSALETSTKSIETNAQRTADAVESINEKMSGNEESNNGNNKSNGQDSHDDDNEKSVGGITAYINKYVETDGGATRENLSIDDLIAHITSYQDETSADSEITNSTIKNLTGILTAYKDETGDKEIDGSTLNALVGTVTEYQDKTDGVEITNSTLKALVGTITEYQDNSGDKEITNSTVKNLVGIVTSYEDRVPDGTEVDTKTIKALTGIITLYEDQVPEGTEISNSTLNALVGSVVEYRDNTNGAEITGSTLKALVGTIIEYQDKTDGAEIADSTIKSLVGVITSYQDLTPEGSEIEGSTIKALVGVITSYEDKTPEGAEISNSTIKALVGAIVEYKDVRPPNTEITDSTINNLVGIITSYQDATPEGTEIDESTIKALVGIVTAYEDAPEGVDDSGLTKKNALEGAISKYTENLDCDKSQLLQNFVAHITAYDDTGATQPEVKVGANEESVQGTTNTLNTVESFEISDKNFDVAANGTAETIGQLNTVNDYVIKDKSFTVTQINQVVNGNGAPNKKGKGTGGAGTIAGGTSADVKAFSDTIPDLFNKKYFADGTAHASGTAFNGGSWGAPKTETALVGELGPELIVRDGRWATVGDNGAEFTNIKKGDIIFNHKQTESLLENGYVTGRGKAYASGTAYTAPRKTVTADGLSVNIWNSDNKKNKKSNSGSNSSKAAKDAAEEFKEVFDWIEVRIEEITEKISLQSAKLENAIGSPKQNKVIDDMITLNQKLYDNLTSGAAKYYEYSKKLLSKIPSEYRAAAQDGSIAIEEFSGEVGEQTLQAIQDYREWVQKGADLTQQAEETLTEISNLAKQAIDNIAQDYENKLSIPQNVIDQLEAYNALIETTKGSESVGIYQALIEENNKNLKTLTEQRKKMQAELDAQVEAGNIKKYSQDWYDAINDIAALDTEIIELTTDIYDYQDAINELHWEHFDNLISRLEAVSDETDNLIDIIRNKDVVDEDGNWTDEGIAALGLYAQKLENAEVQAAKYKEEIAYLNKNWKKLGYTEQEYFEKLDELKDGQYDAIKAYNDTKDAIKDLTSERVDAIKEGIERETESYRELIEAKKEELDAEKDLFDFQKGVADQQKEIADIERKLAALSSDNSASARAQRAKLQAELAKAQQELQDTYYDRSVSDQQEALDKELENFREEKDKEIEGWDEYLEETEKVVSDALTVVQSNTGIVYQTLTDMGKEYSLSIAEAITSPWEDGEDALQSYSEKFKLTMSSTVEELHKLATEYNKVVNEIEKAGKVGISSVDSNASTYQNANVPSTTKPENSNSQQYNTYTVKSGDTLSSIAKNKLGNSSRWKEIYNLNKDQISNPNLIYDGQKLKLPKYAKGTIGVNKDQLALIDELGEELVIRPQNGRMTFLEKGSGVVPADLTENLMQWGELDPSTMLSQNKPEIAMSPSVVNNNMEISIDASVGELIHVETLNGNNPAEVAKIVDKAWDKYMKELNSHIRRYVR